MRRAISRALTVAAGLLGQAAAAQVVLGPPITNPPMDVGVLRAADIDGDGHLDLVDNEATGVAVHFGDGRGHFTASVPVQPPIAPSDIDVGDLDGDGYPDIVAALGLLPPQQVGVLRGLGGTSFEQTQVLTIPGADFVGGTRVRLVDLDSDGDLDVVVQATDSPTETEIVALRNDGTAHLAIDVLASGKFGLALGGDFDVDGQPDFVTTVGTAAEVILGLGVVTVFESQAGGGAAPVAQWPHERLIAVADLDGNGRLDVLTQAYDGPSGVRAHLGQLDGSFLQGPTTPLPPFKVLDDRSPLADLDGDGVADLLLFLLGFDPPAHGTVRLGDRAGGFASEDAVAFTGPVNECLPADVNGDGRMDLVSHNFAGIPSLKLFTRMNLTYPAGGPLLDLGHSKLDTNGWPVLVASGGFGAGDTVSFQLFLGLSQASTVLIAGGSQLSLPFHGGTLVPSPDVVIGPMLSDAQGSATVLAHWPPGVPTGTTLIAQFWQTAPGFPTQYAASTAVQVTAP